MSCLNNGSCSNCTCNKCGDTDSIKYTGEYLPCTGIEYGDTLSVVLQKLDEKYCEIYTLLENCSTTDTTTTIPDGDSCSPVNAILSREAPKDTRKPGSSGCCNPVADILNK
jgi:hypothetical protein